MQSDAESTSSGRDRDLTDLYEVVADLTAGELTHLPPFDLASSAALADNLDSGPIAEQLFDVTALRDCKYQVVITELWPGSAEPLTRPVVDTTVASTRMLVALLDGLMDELEARRTQMKGPLTGGQKDHHHPH